jgi:hypothetical protein
MDDATLQRLRARQIDYFHEACFEVFQERNLAYGDAIRVGGFVGAIITLVGDASRLHNLSITFAQPNDSPVDSTVQIRDTLIDVANYAAIAAAMLEDGNVWGGLNAPYPKEEEND